MDDTAEPRQARDNSEKLAYRHIPLYIGKAKKMTMETAAAGKMNEVYGFMHQDGIALKLPSKRSHSAIKYAAQTAT